jgi:hypothetical protein
MLDEWFCCILLLKWDLTRPVMRDKKIVEAELAEYKGKAGGFTVVR